MTPKASSIRESTARASPVKASSVEAPPVEASSTAASSTKISSTNASTSLPSVTSPVKAAPSEASTSYPRTGSTYINFDKPVAQVHVSALCPQRTDRYTSKDTTGATRTTSASQASSLPSTSPMDSGCDTFDSRVVSDEEPEDPPFDVHFYHCELHTRRSRIIGAHREILSAHPKLKQMVAIAETGRRKLIETMQQDVLLAAPGRLQTPVVVDISCLSYPAFRAVVCYIYTSDIHLALAHVTYASVNSSVTPLSEHLFTHAATNDQPSMDVFMLRDLVHLSLMFNLEDLLRAFAQMILPSLSVDNALHIFFHFGGETAEIKERAMAFVFDNFQTIFGRYAKNAGLFEDFFDKEYTGDGSLMNKVDLEISENGEKTRTLTKSSSCNIASMESHKVVEMSKGLDELSVLSDKWPYRLQNEVTANSERDRPLLDRNIDLPGDSYQEVVASDDSSTPSIDCIDLRACSLQKERNANDQPDRTLIDNSDIESCNVRMDVDVGGPYETSVNNGRQVCLLKDEVKTSPDSSDLVSVRIRKDDDESSESDKPSVEADIRSFSSPNERIGYEKLDTSWDYSQLRLCNLA